MQKCYFQNIFSCTAKYVRRQRSMIKGIGHVAFNVFDMDKTIAFYENTLGFRKAFDIDRPEDGAPQDDAPKQGADFNWQCWTHMRRTA